MSDPKSFDFNDHADLARQDKNKPRKAVEFFAGKMEKRLHEKDEKYGFEGWLKDNFDVEFTADKLFECAEEIQEAVTDSWLSHDVCSPAHLDKKCVDIANFAMMISDKIRHQSEPERS